MRLLEIFSATVSKPMCLLNPVQSTSYKILHNFIESCKALDANFLLSVNHKKRNKMHKNQQKDLYAVKTTKVHTLVYNV